MLLTKLHIPPPCKNLVHRSGLYDILDKGLDRKLILVSAPAGFGKTTLISEWIHQHKMPAVWFSIDKGDNDPVNFLSYIIYGTQDLHEEYGNKALKLLQSSNKPTLRSITSMLINDLLNINQHFLLVLDDFHFINNDRIFELVTYFLEHLPGNVQLVIITRSDPIFPVARLRSQGQMIEIRSSDLSFSVQDIFHLFNKKMKLGLSIEDIQILKDKTEGWIAGLQLTSLSMRERENISGFIQTLKGDNRYIMDYMVEEVLKMQPEYIKNFLLQTSVLRQISAPLCNRVLQRNDSQLILEKLEKSNMFLVPLDDERNWYRYHHLFSDLLKHRLQLTDKKKILYLHTKAGKWFEENNMPQYAIEHTIKSGDYNKSMQLLGETVESMWLNGHHLVIQKYGEYLPDEIIKNNAEFCLYYGWILTMNGQISKAEPYLTSAETIIRKSIDDKNLPENEIQYRKKLLGKISVAFAFLNSFLNLPDKILEYGQTAIENLSDDDPLWFSWGWYTIGMANMAGEKFSECIKNLNTALEYSKQSGNIQLISTIAITLVYNEFRMGLLKSAYNKSLELLSFLQEKGYAQITKEEYSYALFYSNLAIIECMWAEIDEALNNIKTASSLSREDPSITNKGIVLVVHSLVLYVCGDSAGAKNKLEEFENIFNNHVIEPNLMTLYISWKGFVLVDQEQYDEAKQFFVEYGVVNYTNISYADEHRYTPYALLLILEQKFEEAEKLLTKLFNMAVSIERTERKIELKILFAILLKATGEKKKAVENLIESLEYVTKNNILVYYIVHHKNIRELLDEVYKVQAIKKTNIPKKLIEKLKTAIEKREKKKEQYSDAGLSTRELDVLRLIADNFTYPEIAAKLFISLNTVKTHVANIRSKLGVDNRTEAVEKAQEKGLIL